MNKKRVCLIGNPNVGKSSVFNALTHQSQHTGNWTGKTVSNAIGDSVFLEQEENKMKIIGMIPARGGSSRFNMKPLAQICGKPMLYWVWKHSKEVAEFEEVYVATDNEEIKLTAKEFDLLHLFITNRGRPFSRQEMLEHVWKYDYTGDARTVDVHIRRLREKIERNTNQPEFILTKWKVGYYFTDQD